MEWWWLCLVPIAFFWIGCPCCGITCGVLSDTFTRANSTTIGANWSEVAGDWSIVSQQLSIGSANAIATAVPTASVPNVYISVSITLGTNGNSARIIFDYVDSSNFHYAEIKAGTIAAGRFRVVEKSGGTDTVLYEKLQPIGTGIGIVVEVCYNADDVLLVRVNQPSGLDPICEITGLTLASGTAGLGTGDFASGSVLFDNFVLDYSDPACQTCPSFACALCTGSGHNVPNEMQATITGAANQNCSTCADYNATFICKADSSRSGASSCWWNYVLSPKLCATTEEVRVALTSVGANYKLGVEFYFSVGTGTPQWEISETPAAQWDCRNLSAEPLNDVTDTSLACDFAGASATITAA